MKTKIPFLMKRIVLVAFVLMSFILGVSSNAVAQSAGDYRSAATGPWTTLTTWQRYSPPAWLTPTAVEGYPGEFAGTGLVEIRAGHTVTIGNTGIVTQPMGILTIQNTGILYLDGGNSPTIYDLKSPSVNVIAGGTIYFNKKSRLTLPANAVLHLTGPPSPGLSGDCSNNCEIYIGTSPFAMCAGAPGTAFTFAELMAGGGTLNSIIAAAVPPGPVCENTSISIPGTYSGAAGTTTSGGSIPGVNYYWTVTGGPSSFTPSTSQNITIPSTFLPGTYLVKLVVSTYHDTQLYTNADSNYMIINALPTLTGATQPAVCDGSAATVNLSGLVYPSTFTLNYSINSAPQTPKTGLVAVSGGTGSFTTPALTYANNGQTLQITGITITNPTTNCAKSFTQNVTLNVNPVSVGGTASGSYVCTGTATTITLTGYTGSIQWQQSADGVNGWANVTGGSGATTPVYTTPNLTATTYYRAVVTSGVCAPANSTTAVVTVVPAAPVADFSANNVLPLVNETVTFTDLSTGDFKTWSWVFTGPGSVVYDAGSATSPNPQVHFTVNGIYSVALTVTNACGFSTKTASEYFHVGYHGSWSGLTSTEWNIASNWHNYLVPGTLTDVTLSPATKVTYWPIYETDLVLGTLCRSIHFDGAAEMTVEGDFSILSGATLNFTGTGGIFRLTGDWANSGTFSCGTGTVEFIGIEQSIIPAGNNDTFYNLKVLNDNKDLVNQANILVTNELTVH